MKNPSKEETILIMASFVAFSFPWVVVRLMQSMDRRKTRPGCSAQRWSVLCVVLTFLHLLSNLAYQALTPRDASRQECYDQAVYGVMGWCGSTWSLYMFQYYKQRVVTMAMPNSTESRASKVFRLMATCYIPFLVVGMPFWVSQRLSVPIDGMCPWIINPAWRFLFPLHTVLDTAISLLSLYLFVSPIWALSSHARSEKRDHLRAIARRNGLSCLLATGSTFLQTFCQFAFRVGERQPGFFWLVENADVSFNIVSVCLSFEINLDATILDAAIRNSLRHLHLPSRRRRNAGEVKTVDLGHVHVRDVKMGDIGRVENPIWKEHTPPPTPTFATDAPEVQAVPDVEVPPPPEVPAAAACSL